MFLILEQEEQECYKLIYCGSEYNSFRFACGILQITGTCPNLILVNEKMEMMTLGVVVNGSLMFAERREPEKDLTNKVHASL